MVSSVSLTSYHQASLFVYKIKPQMPSLQIVVGIPEQARKALDTVSVIDRFLTSHNYFYDWGNPAF